MAQSVLGGIVEQLRNYNDGLSAQHDEAAVAYDKEQVKAAETALATARSNVNAYLAQHPNGATVRPELPVSCRGREQCRDAARAGQHGAEPSRVTRSRLVDTGDRSA